MAKTKKRQAFAEQYVFSAEEFEASGIRELSFEELLKVNGGKVVKDDPWTDKNSETCPYSSNAPRTDSSSSSSSGSSDSYGSSSSASGSSSSSGSSGSSGSGSSSTSSSSGGSNTSSGSSCDGWNNYWSGLTSGGSSSGGSTGGGSSSGNSGASGGSSHNGSDSSDKDYSSGESSGGSQGSGISWGIGYTPPVQSQPEPKPNKVEESSPTQSAAVQHEEAVMPAENKGKTESTNSGTKSRGISALKGFWSNVGNTVKNTTGKIWDKDEDVKETSGGRKANNEIDDTAGSYITSPTWRTGKNVEAAVIHHDEFMDEYMNIRSPKELNKQFADICKTFVGGKYLLGGTVPSTEGGEGIDCSEMPLIGLRRVSGKDIADRTANDILKDPKLVIDSKKWGDQNFVVDDRAGSLTGFDWRPNGESEGNGRFDHITVNIEGGLEIHPSSVSETIKLIPSGSIDRFASTIVHKEFNWRYILGKNKL